jgi:thiosulfate reductase cytochrome b subunit
LGRSDVRHLHDAQRLGNLQCVAEPALHVSPLDHFGGWLAGGIAWHISVMWVLFADGVAYLLYGFLSGHFRQNIRPSGPRAVIRDITAALTGRLGHRLGHYNAVQRLLYAGVIVVICLAVTTGLSIWKPVQLSWLTDLFGGYPVARGIHLAAMICIALFLIVHLATFTVSPAVRGIRFHNPDALSAWDYTFFYKMTPGGVLRDGVPWSEAIKGLMRALKRIEPGSAADLEVDAAGGWLLGSDFESGAQFVFSVAGEATVPPRRVPVILSAGKSLPATANIAPGKVVFEVRNAGNRFAVFGILQLPDATFQRPKLRFTPSLSGKRLLMTQTFRDFFRSEVISATD